MDHHSLNVFIKGKLFLIIQFSDIPVVKKGIHLPCFYVDADIGCNCTEYPHAQIQYEIPCKEQDDYLQYILQYPEGCPDDRCDMALLVSINDYLSVYPDI